MSKNQAALPVERQVFSILEPILAKQLERQDEQGRAMHLMFESMKTMYSDFTEGMAEMKTMVQEVRDTVTLTNAECTMLQSAVAEKSIALAKDRYTDEDEKFSKVVGVHRRMIWKQLKAEFNVPKYNCIRRIDFDGARSFVAGFKPEDYM